MSKRVRRGRSRRNRPRPTPKWLSASDRLDKVAQGRCLLVLSVLSGEKPVTDAIQEAGISRGTYYQLETRALSAMLRALGPHAIQETEDGSPQRQVLKLEERVKTLERGKRRAERLLLMTRRVMGPRKTSLTRSGSGPSRSSKGRKKAVVAKANHPSTPTPTGAGAP